MSGHQTSKQLKNGIMRISPSTSASVKSVQAFKHQSPVPSKPLTFKQRNEGLKPIPSTGA